MIDTIGLRLLRLLSRYWIPTLLLAGLLSSVISSVDSANWVAEDWTILQSLLLAVLVGWLLASSRFRSFLVLFYSLLVGLAAALQGVGNLLPPWKEGFWGWVDELNLRTVRLALRVNSWSDTLQAGGNVKDPGLFIVLLSLVVWGAMIWFLWFLLRKRRVLVGLLPLGLLMAVNVNLSRQPPGIFSIFLAFAILLLAREAFVCRHHDWESRQVDYPDQLGVEWSLSAVVIALIVVGIARLGPLIGTPEGWRTLAEWARSANQETAETARQLFSGVNTPPPPPPGGQPVIYANTPNLDEIGAPLPQGSETVMWVSTSDPPPVMEEYNLPIPDLNVKGHYWRSGIFAEYTGRGWLPAALADEPVAAPAPDAEPGQEAPAGRYYLRQEFEITAQHGGRLFATSEPVRASAGLAFRQTADGSRLVEGRGTRYTVISAATQVTGDLLAQAGDAYPDEVRAAYLQLPDGLPRRVRALAARITAGNADPFHKAMAIQNYLRTNYTYQQATPPPPANRDVVDYFLFERPEGFCSHYASAMAVMLRTQGIPARVVTGYATGEWNTNRSAYRVTPSSAHAWVEVYFPGYGWVEFEPTASQEPFAYQEIGRAGTSAPDESTPTAQVRGASPFLLAVLAALALAALLLPFWLMRAFRATRGDPAQQVNALYIQMRLALAWAGLTCAASVTPDEYLAYTQNRLAPYGRILYALRRVTDLYRRAIYSPRPPAAVDARIASDLWRSAFGEWIRLWVKEKWRGLKSG
mgnify:CR=1 FL=1